MIAGVVVCPGAPLLIPGLADALADEQRDLVAAVRVAAGELSARSDRVVLVCRGGPSIDGAGGGHVSVPELLGPGPFGAGPVLPDDRGLPPECWIARSLLPVGGLRLIGRQLAAGVAGIDVTGGPGERVGILAIADGAACHGADAPMAADDAAGAFDAGLHRTLGTGDPEVLAAWGRAASDDASAMGATAPEVLGVLARLTAGQRFTATATDLGAPFGVGYHLACWWP